MRRRAKVLVAVAGVAVCLTLWNHGKNENELEKKTEETEIQKGTVKYEKTDQGQSQRSLSFINLEGLYFLNSEGEMLFKSAFEKWMNDKTVSNVEVTGVIEELEDGTGYLFYLTCDNGQSVRAEYLEGAFSFSWVESEPSQLLDDSSVPEKPYQEQQEELEALQAEQNVSVPEGEDAGDVVILNPGQLPEGFPEEAEDGITGFLAQEGELRRELYYIEETDEGYLFRFKNERADKKSVLVSLQGPEPEITLSGPGRGDSSGMDQ